MAVGRARQIGFAALGLAAIAVAGWQGHAAGTGPTGREESWPLHGHDRSGRRFSPLQQIDRANVGKLGLAWFFDLATTGGQEATPIMVGGVLYTVSAYDVVYAIDARTGRKLWSYDPNVRAAAARSCCGPVSRGVAVEDGRVFLGALDGRLIALDRNSGRVLWQVQTLDLPYVPAENYSITGAPRVVKGRVIIGNGGAEFGVRGYVTAYDARTGKLDWRFYTVPGKPGMPDDAASDAILNKVASSWHGEWWKRGGGGTAWDAIEYDPELDLLYIGTGNGSPSNQALRSEGKGDNLFLSSIVAVRPETGEYVWHYQETPGEAWDYTSAQNIVLADLKIGGRPRKVLLHAPKNGFFYVLDRATGKLLAADPYVKTSWASRVDLKTGRPVEIADARYYRDDKAHVVFPSSGGGHNWPPMAFSPATGLAYIPAQDFGIPFAAANDEAIKPGVYNTGGRMAGGASMGAADLAQAYGTMKGYLIAWDPVARKAAWRREMPAPFNGGILATAGGLLFEGTVDRKVNAFDARDGRLLWSFPAQAGISAPPITYSLYGVQYVAVMVGYGGGWPMLGGQLALKAGQITGPNRLLVFRLGGKTTLPPLAEPRAAPLDPPADTASAQQIASGDGLYGRYCLRCHGAAAVSASFVPDLRHSAFLRNEQAMRQVVLGGLLKEQGMPQFSSVMDESEFAAMRAYLIHRANEDKKAGVP